MVIASNEWLNNYEDEQKSAAANTTTTTATTTTNTTTNNTPNNIIPPASSSASTSAIATTTPTTTTTIQTATTSSVSATADNRNIINIGDNRSSNRHSGSEEEEEEEKEEETPAAAAESKKPAAHKPFSLINNKLIKMSDDILKTEPTTTIASVINNNNNKEVMLTNYPSSLNSLSNTSIQTLVGSDSTTIIATTTTTTAATTLIATTTMSTAAATTIASIVTTNNIFVNNATITNSNQQHVTMKAPSLQHSPVTSQVLSSVLQSAVGVNVISSAQSSGIKMPYNFINTLNSTHATTTNITKPIQLTSGTISNNNNNSNLSKQLNSSTIGCITLNASQQNLHQNEHNSGQAKIMLHCEPNSHHFQTRTILLTPNIECKVGRLIAKSKASESNAIFDCKVLSRNHAVLWYSNDAKFWVKDTKSSNGTFINENKLGTEAAELHFGDVLKFGVDVMENSRKEIHGCIIAGVKLYLPDGRETISIDDASRNQLTAFSGEGRISFDELHRLNLYMQEVSQREKILKSKLFSVQNILDATRKNSTLCWQSMIAEDQLLHRINSLEKKLQLMEKNVPESALRNEVFKLLDDKNSYQHSAKEALRKMYEERSEAMQMLSKMESAFNTADNECKLLRDKYTITKQSLQDVNMRLLGLVKEFDEFKVESERRQEEATVQYSKRMAEMERKYHESELECSELRYQITDYVTNNELIEDVELQKQAIEKLDAAIADMDLGGGDDDDDDDDNDDNNDDDNTDGNQVNIIAAELLINASNLEKEKSTTRPTMVTSTKNKTKKKTKNNEANTNSNNSCDIIVENEPKKNPTNLMESSAAEATTAIEKGEGEEEVSATAVAAANNDSKRTEVQKSTILRWLENSDLNKKEGSINIFDAICNESDSSNGDDDSDDDNGAGTTNQENNYKFSKNNKTSNSSKNKKLLTEMFEINYINFESRLRNVQQNLIKLEDEIASEARRAAAAMNDMSSATLEKAKEEREEKEVAHDEEKNKKDKEKEQRKEKNSDSDDGNNDAYRADDINTVDADANNDGVDDADILTQRQINREIIGATAKESCKSYTLLKNSVVLLREAYNEFCLNMKEQQQQQQNKPTVAVCVQTQFENSAQSSIDRELLPTTTTNSTSTTTTMVERVEPREYNVACDEDDDDNDTYDDDDDEASDATARLSAASLQTLKVHHSTRDEEQQQQQLLSQLRTANKQQAEEEANQEEEEEAGESNNSDSSSNITNIQYKQQNINDDVTIIEYQKLIKELSAKMEQNANDAQHTLEIMQFECDTLKEKITELNKSLETLSDEKRALQQVINENKSNALKTAAACLPIAAPHDLISEHLAMPTTVSATLQSKEIAVTAAAEEKEATARKAEMTTKVEVEAAVVPIKVEAETEAQLEAVKTEETIKAEIEVGNSEAEIGVESEVEIEADLEIESEATKDNKLRTALKSELERRSSTLPDVEQMNAAAFEQQISEELSNINNVDEQREEELIMYKERFEQMQNEFVQLRNEYEALRRNANAHNLVLLKQMLPYGAVIAAILVYFIFTYL